MTHQVLHLQKLDNRNCVLCKKNSVSTVVINKKSRKEFLAALIVI